MANKEIDHISGVETTGHEWDGLKELNNPLPKWWLYLLYICIAFSVGYYVFYPSWPLATTYTKGLLGYSQRAEGQGAFDAGVAARAEKAKVLASASLKDIQSNPTLLEFARANGKAAFGDNCAPCHGSGATGGPGYPSLQDDDWLWGGTLDQIQFTITHGIRSTSGETRVGDMPAFVKDGLLKKEEAELLADHVLSLSGGAAPADAKKAAQLFADNCASCHGDNAKGNPELGAPNLTDAIWLFGGKRASVLETINNGRKGVMPTWSGRLDPITIKSLAVYVHGLGGGK